MDAQQIAKAAEACATTIIRTQAPTPQRYDPAVRVPPTFRNESRLGHCLWLLQEIPALVEQGREAKAMRWLCFVQGVLWSCGILTISELKTQNRSEKD